MESKEDPSTPGNPCQVSLLYDLHIVAPMTNSILQPIAIPLLHDYPPRYEGLRLGSERVHILYIGIMEKKMATIGLDRDYRGAHAWVPGFGLFRA